MSAIKVLPGVTELCPEQWEKLCEDASPFSEYGFLSALEDAGCVGEESGWYPLIIVLRGCLEAENDKTPQNAVDTLLGAAPAYVKVHSMGEFVYDWSWADAAERSGVPYYPKLVLATPFSPVGGPRLLVHSALSSARRLAVKKTLLEAALEMARDQGCTGVHALFCTDEERRIGLELGFCARLGRQLHWENPGYESFEDYLARFRAKRRNQIRRERRRLLEGGVDVRCLRGAEVDRTWVADAFRFYCATVDRFMWGRRYLNERFFELLWERAQARLHFVVACLGDKTVAGATNLHKAGRVYGRYWGSDHSINGLHFEVCSYATIADCIAHQDHVFEAGAGDHRHKFKRGFLPVETHSLHHHFDPRFQRAIETFCVEEATRIRSENQAITGAVFTR